MMIRALSLLLAVCAMPVFSADKDERWNWYYAAFQSPTIGSQVFLRHGVAELKHVGSKKKNYILQDAGRPDLSAELQLWQIGKGEIAAELHGFFPEQGEFLKGSYKELKNIGNCNFQEIILKPTDAQLKFVIPDGSVLVLSRTIGLCQ